jgi:hypothetical protein
MTTQKTTKIRTRYMIYPMMAKAQPAARKVSMEYLMGKDASGETRIKTLTWSQLARIYHAKAATPAVRNAIRREAKRCGYEPGMVLGLNK